MASRSAWACRRPPAGGGASWPFRTSPTTRGPCPRRQASDALTAHEETHEDE